MSFCDVPRGRAVLVRLTSSKSATSARLADREDSQRNMIGRIHQCRSLSFPSQPAGVYDNWVMQHEGSKDPEGLICLRFLNRGLFR